MKSGFLSRNLRKKTFNPKKTGGGQFDLLPCGFPNLFFRERMKHWFFVTFNPF